MLLYFAIKTMKVSGPNLVTHLEQTPIVEWCAVRFKSKDIYIKDMSLEEIGPCACNVLTVLGSIVFVNRGCGAGGTCMIILLELKSSLR